MLGDISITVHNERTISQPPLGYEIPLGLVTPDVLKNVKLDVKRSGWPTLESYACRGAYALVLLASKRISWQQDCQWVHGLAVDADEHMNWHRTVHVPPAHPALWWYARSMPMSAGA